MGFLDLFRPKWRHSDPDVRLYAVKEISTPDVLASVARVDPSEKVRAEAAGKIEDQAVLIEIATKDTSEWVRRAAVEGIDDQVVLAGIVTGDEYWTVRSDIAKRLDDQELLKRIAREDASEWVRCSAAGRINDQEFLASLARDPKRMVAEVAIERITKARLLAHIVVDLEVDPRLREALIDRVSDPAVLARVALEAPEYKISEKAAMQVRDQALLAEIAKNAKNYCARKEAASRIEDEAALEEIATTSTDQEIAEGAQRILAAQRERAELLRTTTSSDLDRLLTSLDGSDLKGKQHAARKLGLLRHKAAIQSLIRHLGDAEYERFRPRDQMLMTPNAKGEAADALGQIFGCGSLVRMFGDRHPYDQVRLVMKRLPASEQRLFLIALLVRLDPALNDYRDECRGQARNLGSSLHELGGLRLMREAHAEVLRTRGRQSARDLEWMWDEIGDWMA